MTLDYLSRPRKVALLGNKRGKRRPWSTEARRRFSMHERMRRWAMKFNPDTLRLL